MSSALGRAWIFDSRRCFNGGAFARNETKRSNVTLARYSNSGRDQYPRFYYTNNNDSGLERVDAGCIVQLDAEETRHACTVLRLQPGDRLEVCDGRGNVVECELMHGASERKGKRVGKQMASLVVRDWLVRSGDDGTLRKLHQGQSLHWSVAIACGSLKGGRGDWVVEKCAELGARDFIPLLTERSPKLGRSNGREDRWERIAFAAMKQSLGVYAMKVHPPVQSVEDFVDQYLGISSHSDTVSDGSSLIKEEEESCSTDKRVCALMGAQGAEPLYSALKTLPLTNREQGVSEGILIVGPEGDFTAEEYARLVEAGVLPVSLGERRLRTETAAVAMLSCMVAMDVT
eukprot:jgi/Picsp_1/5474/NSC_02833-R1_protein